MVIDALSLRAALASGEEIALIDPREEGVYGRSHLLFAVNVPLSRLELRIGRLVPRKSTRIVLTDAADGLSERAARKLSELGYTAVSILDGGIASWRAAGFELFTGMGTLTKAFGEWVAVTCRTPFIEAADLHRKMEQGEPVVILDSRPLDEYRNMNIPGSINVPVSELVYRFDELAIPPETLVVVNCAGRTRSLIGAQSLINAGVVNRVVALKGGTMAWQMAGFDLEHFAQREAAVPRSLNLAKAVGRARAVAGRGVRKITASELAAFKSEELRTLYVFDVRTAEEYRAGHLADSSHAWGVDLVQSAERFAATRNARIVLVDDKEVRALMTASWLVQAGFTETYVLAEPFAGVVLKNEDSPEPAPVAPDTIPGIDSSELARLLERGEAAVVDFSDSISYRKAHIPGACFAIRSRLQESLPLLPDAERLVVTGSDPALTKLAAADLAELSGMRVCVLRGGNSAWTAAGYKCASGPGRRVAEPEDVFRMPFLWGHYEDREEFEAAAAEYFEWEVQLPEQIRRSGEISFGISPHCPAGQKGEHICQGRGKRG